MPHSVDKQLISIIIPVLNEATDLDRLLPYLSERSNDTQIIVVDGGSTDRSEQVVKKHHCTWIKADVSSRSIQMNLGAKLAKHDILYFLHADTTPPPSFVDDIRESLKNGVVAGCYPFKFDRDNWQLKMLGKLTELDLIFCRGGDQSLFIRRSDFVEIGGYDENLALMEDYDIIRRIKNLGRFEILSGHIIVSSRKYDDNSFLKVSFANWSTFLLYWLGRNSSKLRRWYFQLNKSS